MMIIYKIFWCSGECEYRGGCNCLKQSIIENYINSGCEIFEHTAYDVDSVIDLLLKEQCVRIRGAWEDGADHDAVTDIHKNFVVILNNRIVVKSSDIKSDIYDLCDHGCKIEMEMDAKHKLRSWLV